MSAAEKLKALAEEPVRNMFKIGDALPQILAVVQAAERVCDEEPLYKQAGLDLEAALSALDETLT